MIYATVPTARAARWTGRNTYELEQLCDGRTTAPPILDASAIVIDAWGRPQVVELGDWVVNRGGELLVVPQAEFFRRYRIADRKAQAA